MAPLYMVYGYNRFQASPLRLPGQPRRSGRGEGTHVVLRDDVLATLKRLEPTRGTLGTAAALEPSAPR
jgi:hypothetical protein